VEELVAKREVIEGSPFALKVVLSMERLIE